MRLPWRNAALLAGAAILFLPASVLPADAKQPDQLVMQISSKPESAILHVTEPESSNSSENPAAAETVFANEEPAPEGYAAAAQSAPLIQASGLFRKDGSIYMRLSDGSLAKGWKTFENELYHFEEETGAMSIGLSSIDQNLYYFNTDGSMLKEQIVTAPEGTYFFGKDGKASSGWHFDQDAWYYFAPESLQIQKGLQTISKSLYYFDPQTGAMQTGMVELPQSGKTCYFTKDGGRKTGWVRDQNTWFYFDPETGYRLSGAQTINGHEYILDPANNDAIFTGWKKEADVWNHYGSGGAKAHGYAWIEEELYFFDELSGALQTGWKQDGSDWYYLNKNGAASGIVRIDGTRYSFDPVTKKLKSGWAKDETGWQYFNEAGMGMTGFLQLGGQMYYLNKDNGCISTGWKKIENNWYYFDQEGHAQSGMTAIGNEAFYLDPETHILRTGTFQLGHTTYTTNKSGSIIRTFIDGIESFMQTDGRWAGTLIHGSSIRHTGCAGTSAAMALNPHLTTRLTPLDTCKELGNAGLMNKGEPGVGGKGLIYLGNHYNVPVKSMQSPAELEAALKQGKTVVALMRAGTFCIPGYSHAIFVHGYDQGKTNVLDPLWSHHNGKYNIMQIWKEQSDYKTNINAGIPIFAFG